MEATVLYGARDVRFEDRPEPTIIEPTDAVIRLPFTCICAGPVAVPRHSTGVITGADGP